MDRSSRRINILPCPLVNSTWTASAVDRIGASVDECHMREYFYVRITTP